jgi:hypothetical protein
MSCVFRVSGESLCVDSLRHQAALGAARVWKRGDAGTLRGRVHSTSGFNIVVSDADFDAFEAQVADATDFLRKHQTEIARIAAFDAVEDAVLDFGASLNHNAFAVFRVFPPALVRLAADAGISLCVSCYLCSATDDDED